MEDYDSATLTASPKIENLSYSKSTTVSGATEELYNKGGDSKFTDSDITDWTQTGTDTATLTLDSDITVFYTILKSRVLNTVQKRLLP